MAQLVDFVIYCGVFFNIGVGGRNICLGLIIIIVRNEVFDGVFGEEFSEFRAELRRQSFVVCKHKSRSVNPLDNICHGKCFARTRYAEQGLLRKSSVNSVNKLVYGLRLIARRLVF